METAADRPYGEFYGFYSVSPENLGSTLVARDNIDISLTYLRIYLLTHLFTYLLTYLLTYSMVQSPS